MIQEETQKSVVKNTELFAILEEDGIDEEPVTDGWFLEEDSYEENMSLMDYPFSIDNNFERRSQG